MIESNDERGPSHKSHAEANIRETRVLGFCVFETGKPFLDVSSESVAVVIYVVVLVIRSG